jgi:hypothetical protein
MLHEPEVRANGCGRRRVAAVGRLRPLSSSTRKEKNTPRLRRVPHPYAPGAPSVRVLCGRVGRRGLQRLMCPHLFIPPLKPGAPFIAHPAMSEHSRKARTAPPISRSNWTFLETRSSFVRSTLSSPLPPTIRPNPLIPSQIKLLKTWHSYPPAITTIEVGIHPREAQDRRQQGGGVLCHLNHLLSTSYRPFSHNSRGDVHP